jgi:hypothetical protein
MPALMQARNAFIAGFEHGQQAEREECAKVAETIQEFGLNVATAIRARGTHD